MEKLQIIQKIKAGQSLLSLPQVLKDILKEVTDENCSADKLGDVILRDPNLTSRVLKMSNSSFYQRYSEITTVHQAIGVLGVNTVKCLALSASIFHPDKIAKDTGIDSRELFGYILSVAAASRRIAKAAKYKSTEEAFIAGLLHDIGILFFVNNYPQQYRKIVDGTARAGTLAEAEEALFGINHAEVGQLMAESWGIPADICASIGFHHKSIGPASGATLIDVVRLATLLTRDRFSGYEESLEERLAAITRLSQSLKLAKSDVDAISSELLMETYGIAEYLGLDIGNIEEMLIAANQEIWKSYLLIENLFKERQELSRNLLIEERERGAIESKNIAMATLSHYLNNAAMAIYGRSQILNMHLKKGKVDKVLDQLPGDLDKIDRSVRRIIAVLEEMKSVSPIDQAKFDRMSKAMNIDDLIERRLQRMESGHVLDDVITTDASTSG